MTFRLPHIVILSLILIGAAIMASSVYSGDSSPSEGREMSFRGALVRKALNGDQAVNQPLDNNVVPFTVVTFDQAEYDTDSLWSDQENCFVVPEGVRWVRLQGQIVFLQHGSGTRQLLVQRKSASNKNPDTWEFFAGQPIQNTEAVSGTTTDPSFSSVVLPVTPGDKFALMAWQTSGETIEISGGTGTFFAMEIIDGGPPLVDANL